MEKALAEVLGISVEELEKLMAQLGINLRMLTVKRVFRKLPIKFQHIWV